MSKNRNYRNNYRNESSQNYKHRSDRDNNKGRVKKKNNSLIFIKSSVVALTLILLTLMVSLLFKVGSNKTQTASKSCSNKPLKLSSQIDKVSQFRSSYIIATTKIRNAQQEIVILNDCLNVVRRKTIVVTD